jgi:hypothetical protein
VLCAIFDEVSFWRSETSVAPDVETYHAVTPGLATLPGSLLIGISSPYKKSGLLYDKWRQHYAQEARRSRSDFSLARTSARRRRASVAF